MGVINVENPYIQEVKKLKEDIAKIDEEIKKLEEHISSILWEYGQNTAQKLTSSIEWVEYIVGLPNEYIIKFLGKHRDGATLSRKKLREKNDDFLLTCRKMANLIGRKNVLSGELAVLESANGEDEYIKNLLV
ncbi:MAG: hypothetical protein QXL94_01075 [Candidatus Parvarchaeum sp.]